MSLPNARLVAYQKTARILSRELPSRIVVVACVAYLVTLAATLTQAVIWVALMTCLLFIETRLYRQFHRGDAARVSVKAMTTVGVTSALCSVCAAFPLAVFMHQGTVSAHFAAAAYMAGILINVIVNNSAHPLIFAVAAGPFAVVFLGAAATVSMRADDPTAALTAAGFVVSAVLAHVALARNMRAFSEAAADADRERETALRASQAKSEFLAKMGHEIRTPLNGILGMAQAMGADGLTPAQKDRVQIIVHSGDALLAILNDVLDHADIESGALAINPAPARLTSIVERATAPLLEMARRKGVAFSLDLGALAADNIVVDAHRLEKCIAHIVSNAVKFTASGGVFVTVRAIASDAGASDIGAAAVEISVRDTGSGMSADELARAFEPFEQADNSIRRRFGGAGLGLPLARTVIRAMGGDISAVSTPGEGSEFVLTLTVQRASLADATAAEAAPAGCARPSVLVVEDNLVNYQVVKAMLDKHARAVAHAENGAAALARLDTEKFDVIFMDMHMPVMDGLTATREIRASKAAWSKTPIIFVTAAASAEDEGVAYASGADAFIAKPVKADALLRALSNASRRAA